MAKQISSEVQAIISASDAGLLATTAALSQRHLKSHPEDVRILIEYGRANWQLSRYAQSAWALTTALELVEENKRDVILGELGNLHRAQGDFVEAVAWYKKQIDADPTDATGYLFLGATLLQQGSIDEAISALQAGLSCELGCLEEVLCTLGMALRAQGNFNDAAAAFENALEMSPNFAAAKTCLKDVKSAK